MLKFYFLILINSKIHTIKLGEDLNLISRIYGITIEKLLKQNGLKNISDIKLGTSLIIDDLPYFSTPGIEINYTISQNDTLEKISYNFGTSSDSILKINQINDSNLIIEGKNIKIPSGNNGIDINSMIYHIEEEDTLEIISNKFNININILLELNSFEDINLIYPGQIIFIPIISKTPKPGPIYEKSNYKITRQNMIDMKWVESSLDDIMLNDLNFCCELYSINTIPRIRHFISQCSHESYGGRYRAEGYDGIPYNWRVDLGNKFENDGPKYKGAGYIQITGRYNYIIFSNFIGDQNVMLGVDYVAENYPWTSAGFWWFNNKMNEFIDTNPTVEEVTYRVNGGYNGLKDRQRYYNLSLIVFQ